MKKKFFGKQLSEKLLEIIRNDFTELKTLELGELSKLPSPTEWDSFLPGIILIPLRTRSVTADNESIVDSVYSYTMYYLKMFEEDSSPYNFVYEDSEKISQIILENKTLGDFKIPDGGRVINCSCENVLYDNSLNSYLKTLEEVNIVAVEFDPKIYFRTLRG